MVEHDEAEWVESAPSPELAGSDGPDPGPDGVQERARSAQASFKSTDIMEDPDVEEFVGGDGLVRRRRRVRKRKAREVESEDWAKHEGKSLRVRWLPVAGAGLVVLVAVALVAYLWFDLPGGRTVLSEDWRAAPVLVTPERDGGNERVNEEGYEIPAKELEAVVRRFFAAETIDEMARWVRDRERVLPLMRGFYARRGHEFRPEACKAVGEDETAFVEGAMTAVLVTLGDWSQRQIALRETPGGFLVDWESWVGYSEMSWEEFARDKPVEPRVFRVRMKREAYYNFGFSDDSQWLCFRLLSPADDMLWGYAREESAPGKLHTWHLGDREELVTLRLRFPENATRPDQVVIDGIVASGWVVHDGG